MKLKLDKPNIYSYYRDMGNDPLQRMKLLGERLRRVDKSLSKLMAERLSILAEIARLQE
jgi:chorismate mutase